MVNKSNRISGYSPVTLSRIVYLGQDFLLTLIAVLLTVMDLLIRGSLLATTTLLKLLVKLCGALLLMVLFILFYFVGMLVYLAMGPGINTHL